MLQPDYIVAPFVIRELEEWLNDRYRRSCVSSDIFVGSSDLRQLLSILRLEAYALDGVILLRLLR